MEKKLKYTLISIILLMSIGLFVLNEDIIEETPSEEFIYNLESSNIFINTDTTWNLTGSPYYINEDYIIEAGATLTIEPGVQILFNGSYSIIVDGALNATGTKEKPIFFSSNSTTPNRGDWNSITIRSAVITTIIKNVNISYADIGINIEGGLPQIINNTIYENNYGIRGYGLSEGDLIVENNSIYNSTLLNFGIHDNNDNIVNYYIRNNNFFNSENNFESVALSPGELSKIVFENNRIYNNSHSGIRFYFCELESLIFQNNSVYNNHGTASNEYGISFEGVRLINPLFIQYNEIYNNSNNGVFFQNVGGYPCCNTWIDSIYFQYNKIYNNLNDGVFSSFNKINTLISRYNEIYNNSNNGFSICGELSPSNYESIFFQNNEIYNNSNGIYMSYWVGDEYIVKNNNFYNNSNYAIECRWEEPSEIINMASNWWGTNNTNEIDGMVYDYYDNILYAKVNYTAFLNHSVIEIYNAEPPQWSNLQINDTSIYLGDQVNISIKVSDNINVSKVWIEIDNNIYNMINVNDSNTYCFIFTPTELMDYQFTIYMNDTSGILNTTTGVISILQINDNNEIPAEDENDLIVILLMTTILLSIVGVPSIYVITSKKKEKEGVKLKRKFSYDKLPKKVKEESYKLYLEQKAQEKRARLLKRNLKAKGVDIKDLDLQEIKIVSIFEGKNAIETMSDLGDVNITILSEEYLEKIEKFEWDENEKEFFLEEMLALPPEKRDVILEHMIEKSKSKNLKE